MSIPKLFAMVNAAIGMEILHKSFISCRISIKVHLVKPARLTPTHSKRLTSTCSHSSDSGPGQIRLSGTGKEIFRSGADEAAAVNAGQRGYLLQGARFAGSICAALHR
ncbi:MULTISPECIES: hypothetical protein [Pseudomonas]|uniref:hypothetical protein n=1 Tax=Pseudomonas TaxID=286 RepID=UPI001FCD3C28|nr:MULTISPECIES: hypothetical protein [Pseudomonas]MCL8305455.1 hypothetical protein [Pseudomonas putida]